MLRIAVPRGINGGYAISCAALWSQAAGSGANKQAGGRVPAVYDWICARILLGFTAQLGGHADQCHHPDSE